MDFVALKTLLTFESRLMLFASRINSMKLETIIRASKMFVYFLA